MTIARDSKLARAFRIARQTPRPAFRAQGYVAPAYGETTAPELTPAQIKSRKARYPSDGMGHAMHALTLARGMVEAPAPIYGGMPGPRYPDTDSAFRDTTPAHDVSGGPDHKGWYTSPYGDCYIDGSGLCFGVVARLPGKGGKCRFVAGYQFGGVDGGPTLDLTTVYESENHGWHGDTPDAMTDAARVADELARIAGEKEREYQTAWQAGSQWAGELETVQEARKEALAILTERRAARGAGNFPALCAAIRGQVETLRETMTTARARMAKLAGGDCESLYFWTGDETLQGAFCEGAGLDAMPGAGA